MFPYRTEIQDAGRNADAGGIDLDADAQLCQFPCFPINFQEIIKERPDLFIGICNKYTIGW
jgi:hypothetical protein